MGTFKTRTLISYKQIENISKYMGPKHWHKKKNKRYG